MEMWISFAQKKKKLTYDSDALTSKTNDPPLRAREKKNIYIYILYYPIHPSCLRTTTGKKPLEYNILLQILVIGTTALPSATQFRELGKNGFVVLHQARYNNIDPCY